jgi:type II secretory pathway component GspD/PulD (secretin)
MNMKMTHKLFVLAAIAVGAINLSAQQPTEAPAKSDTNAASNDAKPAESTPPPATPGDNATPAPQAGTPAPAPNTTPAPGARTDGLIMMNFRGASLDTVLNHMSSAAGYIINVKPGVSLRNKVDVWSANPLTKDQAFNLLQTVLHQNNLTAIDNESTLNIIPLDEGKIGGIPVVLQKDPKLIPKNDVLATYIIPVQFVEASQLLKDLTPLVSSQNTTMTANESGNSIVITDTQANIHRVAEIINNIDSGAQSFTEVRRFKLHNSDPGDIADLLSNLFPDESQSNGRGGGNNPFSRFASRFGGGGGFMGGGGLPGFGGGGPPGMGTPGGGGSSGSGDQRARRRTRVIAVAEQRTSSVVVQATKELMEQVADVIEQIDADKQGKMMVSVINVENTDMQQLNQVLQDTFQRHTTVQNRNANNQNNNNALTTRANGNASSYNNSSRSSSSGFGSSSGRGGGAGSLLQP